MVGHNELFAFGNKVRYDLDGFSGEGIMIGFPVYSKDCSVLVLADDAFHGIPINMKWCKRLRRPDIEKAKRLRERYDSLYPTFLQGLE